MAKKSAYLLQINWSINNNVYQITVYSFSTFISIIDNHDDDDDDEQSCWVVSMLMNL